MTVRITDDFALNKIVESGQCFRPRKLDANSYLFITGNDCVTIKQLGDEEFDVSCTAKKWDSVWRNYFDLERSYKSIREKWSGDNEFLDAAMEYGKGIRILRQDPWEALVSFIISQRKSIPAIRKSVEFIASHFSRNEILQAEVADEALRAFPSATDLRNITAEELSDAGLGYRLDFVLNAIKFACENREWLKNLHSVSDEQLLEELMKLKGVGIKVANCVALFSYARVGLAPVDVWIQKAIDDHWGGINPFPKYGDVAGIMQQYVFFYERNGIGKK